MKKKFKIPLLLFFIILILYTSSIELQAGKRAKCPTGEICIDNPIGENNINILIGQVINAVLGIVGSLALVMFIYGGFTWMLAAGNNEKVQKGKDILIWATIGLVVIFSAYAIVFFVFQGLGIADSASTTLTK